MDERLRKEIGQRRKNCKIIASQRAYHALLIVGKGPDRTGDLKYLANHSPGFMGHPRRYGFRGRSYSFLILPVVGEPIMVVSTPFYEEDIEVQDVRYANDMIHLTASIFRELGLCDADIGLVGTDIISAALYRDLRCALPGVRFHQANDIVMMLRAKKSPVEIEMHRIGARAADNVVNELKDFLKPGLTELDVYHYICSSLERQGVTDTYATCQSGILSRVPYIPCTDKVINNGDMVHMEINGFYNGYQIDICRSTVVGNISKDQERILDICCEMLDCATKAVRPGIRAEELEFITTDIAKRYGLEKNHTATTGGPGTYLGHAIGLGLDEPPCIAKGDLTILEPGMVLALEPGIYGLPCGGCRIEDEILVTETGYERLNLADRRIWE